MYRGGLRLVCDAVEYRHLPLSVPIVYDACFVLGWLEQPDIPMRADDHTRHVLELPQLPELLLVRCSLHQYADFVELLDICVLPNDIISEWMLTVISDVWLVHHACIGVWQQLFVRRLCGETATVLHERLDGTERENLCDPADLSKL